MRVTTENFSEVIEDMLEDYREDVQEILNTEARRAADSGAKELRESSNTPKRTGEYAKSWSFTKDENLSTRRLSDVYIIRNKKHYRLTHLLEFGHVIVQTGGRTRAFPHIAPVEKKVMDSYQKRVVEGINEIT